MKSSRPRASKGRNEEFQKRDRSARLIRAYRYVTAAGTAGVRPEDLAKRLGVSRRTAYRDLQALEREVEMPIWNEHGRWGVTEKGLLPALHFSRDEALSIVLAARLLAKFSTGYDPEFGAALMKLCGMLEEPLRTTVERTVEQIAEVRGDPEAQQLLRKVAGAWISSRVVEFDYAAAWSNPGATRRARVRPYLIEPSAATLATYLIGYDEGRDAMRTFRLDRMSNAQVGITTFVRPRDMELEKQLSAAWDIVADQPLEEVVIKFSSSAAARVVAVRWHPSQETEMQGDGSLLWRARLSGTHEVRPWILGWGGDAEVITPVPLRDDIARTHRDAATVYGA